MHNWQALALFVVFVLGLLALDLGIFHGRPRAISLREATAWSAFWITLSLAFNVGLYFWRGPEPALEFLAGYILEKSLSLDNIFVFAVIFNYTGLPAGFQYRILFWGILGALVIRGLFIAAGVALIVRFHWVMYIFGGLLFVTGTNLLRRKRREMHPERHRALRFVHRIFGVSEDYEGFSFFVRRGGRLFATPLFIVLVMVEVTDVVFALDSIPAIFGVTQDPFVIYTSNVLAILGLRAMYFWLAGALAKFRYLHVGLSLVLMFIGAKMLLARFYNVPLLASLVIICALLGTTVITSLRPEKRSRPEDLLGRN